MNRESVCTNRISRIGRIYLNEMPIVAESTSPRMRPTFTSAEDNLNNLRGMKRSSFYVIVLSLIFSRFHPVKSSSRLLS